MQCSKDVQPPLGLGLMLRIQKLTKDDDDDDDDNDNDNDEVVDHDDNINFCVLDPYNPT